MDIVKVLSVMKEEREGKFRLIESVRFREHWLSIQASYGHYCLPRETLSIEKYTHFEVLANIPDEDIPKKWLDEYHDSDNVFGYVPKAEIEELIGALNNKYGIDLVTNI